MSTDMFPDSFINYCLENPLKTANPTSTDRCVNCGDEIEVMAFKKTGACSVNCRKELGDDVSSVGTHMFVTTDEIKLIVAFRKKEGITIDGRRLTAQKKKAKQADKNEPAEFFVCRCGHPGAGCYCR